MVTTCSIYLFLALIGSSSLTSSSILFCNCFILEHVVKVFVGTGVISFYWIWLCLNYKADIESLVSSNWHIREDLSLCSYYNATILSSRPFLDACWVALYLFKKVISPSNCCLSKGNLCTIMSVATQNNQICSFFSLKMWTTLGTICNSF